MDDGKFRIQKIEAVLAEWIQAHGELCEFNYTAVIAAYPELMPELEVELKRMQAIDKGVRGLELHTPVDDTSSSNQLISDPSPRLALGEHIGPYELLGVLGEGGMGIVFRARQLRPQRDVALKVIRSRFASEKLRRRFEQEAEVLGRLQHQCIAQVFEAGTFGEGRDEQPFFAMELVRGSPLTEYCTAQDMGTFQRLELFSRICDGVHHAHEHGVIHRDLKPENILVTQDGHPKVLDFGVARAIDSDIQLTTVRTDVAQLIGTIPYMSPEQVEGHVEAIDARSDVYALGVVFYEVLTGRLPYDVSRKSLLEAARTIREDIPARPSSFNVTLRGEIEIIVSKALEKDRNRRYPTAAAFGEDIARFLANQPILARPPTIRYRLSKYSQRHRAGLLAMAIIIVAGILSGLFATRARTNARDARAAEAARLVLQGVNLTSMKNWSDAQLSLEAALRLQPENADAMANLARLHLEEFNTKDDPNLRHLLVKAEKESEEAIRIDPTHDRAWNILGVSRKKLGKYEAALAAYDQILITNPSSYFALVNKGTLLALLHRTEEAYDLLIESTRVEQACPYSVDTWRNLAAIQFFRGELEGGFASLERAINCNPDDFYAQVFKARFRLATEVEQATSALAVAEHLSRSRGVSLARLHRLKAHLSLCRGAAEDATNYASKAISEGDLPVVNHLLIALARCRAHDLDGTKASLTSAQESWPQELKVSEGYVVVADGGVLWFETASQLKHLYDCAQLNLSILESPEEGELQFTNVCP